jgi:hypothetical protein
MKVFYDFHARGLFRSFRLFQSFMVLIPSKTFGLLVLSEDFTRLLLKF